MKYSETWLPIFGYTGLYSVSNQGRVRSLDRKVKHYSGSDRKMNGRILNPTKSSNGYLTVYLSREGVKKNFCIHQLVLEAFIGSRPLGYQGSHLDGDRKNNRLVNLKWESVADNQNRRASHNTSNRGERQGASKLNNNSVRYMRGVYALGGYTYSYFARMLNVSPTTIANAIKRKTWKHLN